MSRKAFLIMNIILILVLIVMLFELYRDSTKNGDFLRYVKTGKKVINNQDIYSYFFNTWPPFFSVFSALLSFGDSINSFLIRFIWLSGSIISMYYIVATSVKMVFNKPIVFSRQGNGTIIQDTLIVIPLLIILRYILENLTNIQINIFMLFCAILSIKFFIEKKYIWVGLLLALTISLKVYTIFFLFYFLFKREFKPAIWTMFFLALINSVCFFVFGFDQTIHYFKHWVTEVAPLSYIPNHNNQSLFGMFLRFFSSENPGQNIYVNLFSFKPDFVKLVTYSVIAAGAVYPAFLCRKKLKETGSQNYLLEYSLIFTAIPLLSPLSWKAYFIFLWVPYFLLYAILFRSDTIFKKGTLNLLKYIYWFSILLTVGLTELFVGGYFSDIMETYSAITIGTIILMLIQIFLIINIKKFDIKTIVFMKMPEKK